MLVLKRYFLTLFIFCLSMMGFQCQAQEVEDTVPNFALCFDILAKNRDIYNHYNDSIFLIKDHDKWVNFFRRRALKNHQLFASNKEAIRTIKDYFYRKDSLLFPREAASNLFISFRDNYLVKGKGDPFLQLEICRILDSYNQSAMDSVSFAVITNMWLASCYSQIWNLGKDSLALKKAYECEKILCGDDFKNLPYYDGYKLYALANLSQTTWLFNHLQTLSEYRDCVKN